MRPGKHFDTRKLFCQDIFCGVNKGNDVVGSSRSILRGTFVDTLWDLLDSSASYKFHWNELAEIMVNDVKGIGAVKTGFQVKEVKDRDPHATRPASLLFRFSHFHHSRQRPLPLQLFQTAAPPTFLTPLKRPAAMNAIKLALLLLVLIIQLASCQFFSAYPMLGESHDFNSNDLQNIAAQDDMFFGNYRFNNYRS
ncbi:unnamed protein product [Caenorhabditis auriculariae]|uniref:Uncharacterized protein n=1 Tax=Caenorhabditis auriculariae TaxID=2777116 RepID=A0A8S1HQ30_9PELO|nr:unnamed protein product [Caenorhabditis auriculariae]